MILARTLRTLPILLMITGITLSGRAQTKEIKYFSLKEAQDYAVNNSYTNKNSQIDVMMAKKKVWETKAIGLPQINGSVQYQDMLDIPTTLLPDFITPSVVEINKRLFGLEPTSDIPGTQFFPAKFGTQHNMSVGATLSQLIFSGQYIVGLQAIQTFYEMTNENKQKTDIETRQAVANTYTLLSVLKENIKVLKDMLPTTERMVFEADESFKNGLIDDITRDQVKLNLTIVHNNINALERNIDVTERLLKFQMGMEQTEAIALKDSVKGLINQLDLNPILTSGLNIDNHIDYRMIKTQEKVQWLNLRKEQSTYLPVISGFYTFQQKAMRNTFDIFDSKGVWYPTSIIGVQMDIPIFSSFSRQSKVKQARLALEKAQNLTKQVAQGLELTAEQSRTTFNSALEKYKEETDNYQLADNIFKKTNVKFKEGIASSTEVTLATNQFLSSEAGYYNSILELLIAKLNYEKAINNQ